MAGVAADWRRAALADRFLRPRLAGGGEHAPAPVPPADPAGAAAAAKACLPDLARFLRDPGAYLAGLDGSVHDADTFTAAPDELAAAHAPAPGTRPACWYFVSPVPHRRHGNSRRWRPAAGLPGEWVHQGHDKHVEAGGCVRHVWRYFYVADGRDRDSPTEWILEEQGIKHGGGQEQLVLCKLYRPRRWPAAPPLLP